MTGGEAVALILWIVSSVVLTLICIRLQISSRRSRQRRPAESAVPPGRDPTPAHSTAGGPPQPDPPAGDAARRAADQAPAVLARRP
ncbi:MAG TPA: hypothetical protein VEC76_18760 [Streptosporangiaceae bacterium]|nr:hypothetical protein [Streptosporangiaceae bacterium]